MFEEGQDGLNDRKSVTSGEHRRGIDSLNHLIPKPPEDRFKEEAALHQLSNLEAIYGPVRCSAINPELLKENPKICVTCGLDFKYRAGLHTHLTRHRHIFGQLDIPSNLPKYECRSCENVINSATMLKHRCYGKQQADIKARKKLLDKAGSALVCILCRGRLLPSRVHLIIHIIVAHSLHRDPFKCVFCHAEFTSENLMMQELHAFDCHAPVLFILTRKATFKIIRNLKGNVVDPSVPFTCFYDSLKLENIDFTKSFKNKSPFKNTMNTNELTQNQDSNLNQTKQKVCTANFNTLAEFTAHLCCYHCAVTIDDEKLLNDEDDLVEGVRRAQNQKIRVPGPTVRELLKSQKAGHHTINRNDEDISQNIITTQKSSKSIIKKKISVTNTNKIHLRQRNWLSRSSINNVENNLQFNANDNKEQCRMCLEKFSDENKLQQHVIVFHLPEHKKRLKHLAEKKKLSALLDLDRLCTDCYILYPDVLSLQVHMMVSHASKDWRHCGLCNYEFFSDIGGTPSHLRLVLFQTDGKNTRPGNQPAGGGGSTMDFWPLPPELMWRMIMTHEIRHRENLFPLRQVPYMPTQLVDQLIGSKAIQAGMAANWLIRRAKEELEGLQASDEPMEGIAGPITTREAFGVGQPRARTMSLNKEMVEEARAALAQLTRHSEDSDEVAVAKTRLPSARFSLFGAGVGGKLPNWLVKKFSELGERNAAKQVELDFAENL